MKRLVWACLAAIGLGASCGHAFPYKYHVLGPDEAGELRGTLRAAKPKDDLPLKVCAPDEQDQGKCIVVSRAVWDAIRNERVELLERLKACEEAVR